MSVARLMQMARAGVPAGGGGVWTDPDLANASYDSVSFSVAGQDLTPTGMFFGESGAKLYISGFANKSIFQYSLSAPYDISTASYDSVSLNVNSQDSSPQNLYFNTDGTKMFHMGFSTDTVYQYTLSTGFDLSTASYDSVNFSFTSQETDPTGLTFSPSGEKMFVVGNSQDSVFQYSLSTPFDLSTASYDSVSFSVASQEGFAYSLTFSPDGTKMFVIGINNDTVYQYTLSTGFDVSTASYDSVSFSYAAQEGVARSLAFNDAGSKMYVVGSGSDTIYQYSTA
jgi:6-phosphogluconolactonase (cycloisomerase 2 family)